jgi:type IV pilus assembly protein PilE
LNSRPNAGFTLIELVVAVTIVGLLTVIAMPAYRIYVLRSNRAVAKAVLVDMAAREETYFVDRKTYGALSVLGLNTYLNRDSSTSATQTSSSIYQLSVGTLITTAACPATGVSGSVTSAGYTVAATPVGTQVNDTSCVTLCLTSTGMRLASAGTAADCWSR